MSRSRDESPRSARRPCLARISRASRRYHIFKVQSSGYIFFGTASTLYNLFRDHVATSSNRPYCQRTKVAIIDMSEVYGIDATATAVFIKARRLAAANSIELVWAGVARNVEQRLAMQGLDIGSDGHYADLDAAEKATEDALLAHVHTLAQHWLIDKTVRRADGTNVSTRSRPYLALIPSRRCGTYTIRRCSTTR